MSTFIGRTSELRVLKEAFASRKTEFIPVYGRRRVGKSELLLHAIRDQLAVYYLGKKAPAGFQIREFLATASRAFGNDLLASVQADDWKAAFNLVFQQRPAGRKLVVVLDEFQWIAEASPELPSLLQEFLDRSWRESGDVVLVLCGSYLGFMEREVLSRQSPLYGRRSAQILLKPFPYHEAAQFHPQFSLEDRAKTYFVCGGIPYYLQFFDASKSIAQNIQRNFFEETSALFREVDFLLREELRELENYYGILTTLATGSLRLQQIAQQTQIPERSIHYYLQQLVELGYVIRRFSLTGGRTSTRMVRFQISDPLLRFWFRFVYPSLSYVAQVSAHQSFQQLVKPHLDAYFGSCFERLCREALPMLYLREQVTDSFEVGEYWDNRIQIDVVGVRRDGHIDLCECKWGTPRSIKTVFEELSAKAQSYPNPKNATIQKRLFLRRAVRTNPLPADVRLHTLQDLS